MTGRDIGFVNLDLATEYDRLADLPGRAAAGRHRPLRRAARRAVLDAVVRAKRYTVDNNVRATHNLLVALVATGSSAALVHLGTMGVYGYGWSGSAPIPEGYLTVKVPTPDGEIEREILHPANPGSVYHMTKTLDQLMFAFYAKNDSCGSPTCTRASSGAPRPRQTARDERLINRFDYDGDYGTVLNRFLMQAAIGHPLTVHGSGGQTRAFIHIRDTRPVHRDRAGEPARGRLPADRPQPDHRDPPGRSTWPRWSATIDGRGDRVPAEPEAGGRRERAQRCATTSSSRSGSSRPRCPRACSRSAPRSPSATGTAPTSTKIVARSVWRAGMETSEDLLTKLPELPEEH